MTLEKTYLEYPMRRHGMDHHLYPVSNAFERAPVTLPDNARVALWVVPLLEYFPLTVGDGPFKAPGHMVTPYPDMRHYTSRDYGNRVGIFRFLKVFDQLGIKASVATQSAVAERYPALISELVSRGYELIGHSTDANGIQYGGMSQSKERALITHAISALEKASGAKVRGWHCIAKSESENTLALLSENGIDDVCDWVNDDLPYEMTTPKGMITAMPLTQEISDRQIIIGCHQTEEQYVEQVKDQFDTLYAESAKYGGRILALTLTPYIMGLPYRIAALREVLEYITGHNGVWSATGAEILDAFKA